MQLSTEQIQQLSHGHTRGRLDHWKAVADAALPPAQRLEPQARLKVLADAVARAQGAQAEPLGVEVHQAAQWLALGLTQGVAWREARAVGLLHAAAALGAMWFVDGRLLPQEDMLPLGATLEASMAALLLQAHGRRYKMAAQRERERRPALRAALQRLLAAPGDAAALQNLSLAAFAQPDDDEDEAGVEDAAPPAALEQFLQRERSLCAQAGITDHSLLTLCIAGDLAYGLGRCVRMLKLAPTDAAERSTWLKETLHDLARPQP